MKRKLLDASLIVFATALFVRLTIVFAPYEFHLPRYMREDSNAAMVISAAFAVSLGLSLLLPRIKLPHLTRSQIKVSFVALAALAVIVLGTIAMVRHGTPQDIFDKVTSDDGKP